MSCRPIDYFNTGFKLGDNVRVKRPGKSDRDGVLGVVVGYGNTTTNPGCVRVRLKYLQSIAVVPKDNLQHLPK